MARNEDNTVSSKNQIALSDSVYCEDRNGKKILFLGNSITKHAEAPAIGWNANWGMAASSEDKDYVHRTMAKVWEKVPNTSFMVGQLSAWEREFWNETLIQENFPEIIDYKADIVIIRVIENVSETEHDGYTFEKGYKKLIDTVSDKHTKVILTNSFWQAPEKDAIVAKVAKDEKYTLVDMCIGADDRYTAQGLFEHLGVAAHPGDEGMEEIANRIFAAIEEYL